MVAAGSLRAEEAQGGAAVASETGFPTEAGQWEGERYLSEPKTHAAGGRASPGDHFAGQT